MFNNYKYKPNSISPHIGHIIVFFVENNTNLSNFKKNKRLMSHMKYIGYNPTKKKSCLTVNDTVCYIPNDDLLSATLENYKDKKCVIHK